MVTIFIKPLRWESWDQYHKREPKPDDILKSRPSSQSKYRFINDRNTRNKKNKSYAKLFEA